MSVENMSTYTALCTRLLLFLGTASHINEQLYFISKW